MLRCWNVAILLSCSYSSVEFIHGAASDAMHTEWDSALSRQTLWAPDHFSINRTTQAHSPGICPRVAPCPASVSMVIRAHLLSPPGGVQCAVEFGRCVQCEDQPTQISERLTITTTLAPPLMSHFKAIHFFFASLRRSCLQFNRRLIYLLTIF